MDLYNINNLIIRGKKVNEIITDTISKDFTPEDDDDKKLITKAALKEIAKSGGGKEGGVSISLWYDMIGQSAYFYDSDDFNEDGYTTDLWHGIGVVKKEMIIDRGDVVTTSYLGLYPNKDSIIELKKDSSYITAKSKEGESAVDYTIVSITEDTIIPNDQAYVGMTLMPGSHIDGSFTILNGCVMGREAEHGVETGYTTSTLNGETMESAIYLKDGKFTCDLAFGLDYGGEITVNFPKGMLLKARSIYYVDGEQVQVSKDTTLLNDMTSISGDHNVLFLIKSGSTVVNDFDIVSDTLFIVTYGGIPIRNVNRSISVKMTFGKKEIKSILTLGSSVSDTLEDETPNTLSFSDITHEGKILIPDTLIDVNGKFNAKLDWTKRNVEFKTSGPSEVIIGDDILDLKQIKIDNGGSSDLFNPCGLNSQVVGDDLILSSV